MSARLQDAFSPLPTADLRYQLNRTRTVLPEAMAWWGGLPAARKGKSKLTLQCPPELLPLLRAQQEQQILERAMVGDDWEDHDLALCQENGRPISRTEDWREWKTILKKAGVRDGRLHDARHTAATLLVEQGVHIRVVHEVLATPAARPRSGTCTSPHQRSATRAP